MPRQLQFENAKPDDVTDGIVGYVQFRGRQTSVTHDGTGVHFGTEHRHDMVAHRAYPVVDPDADLDDVPDDAILEPVAEQLIENNPLVYWGVACEVDGCDDVFATPRGEASHYGAVHGEGHVPDQDADDGDADDQSVGDTEADGGEA